MAVISSPNASALKLKFNCGMDENGDILMKTRTLNYLKYDATNDDIMEIANALADLQKHNLNGVTRVDNTSLSE